MLGIVTVLFRLFPFIVLWFQPKYHFLNTNWVYYLKTDSWYYADVLRLHPAVWYGIGLLVVLATVFLFYVFLVECKIDEDMALFGSLFLVTFPQFFDQTVVGMVDTPLLILFFIVCMALSVLWYFTRTSWAVIPLFLSMIGVYLLWDGSIILLGILIISLGVMLLKRWWEYLILGLGCVGGLIYGYPTLLQMWSIKQMGNIEYSYNLYFVYWAVILFVGYYAYKDKIKKFDRFLLSMSIIFAAISLVFIRFTAFALLFMIPFLFRKLEGRFINYVAGFFILNMIISGMAYSQMKPFMTQDTEKVISQVDGNIVNFWDIGHQVNYFGGNSCCLAEPKNNTFEVGMTLPEDEGVVYLDSYYEGSYELYFTRQFENKTKLNFSDSSIFMKSVRNESLIYYDVIGQSKDAFLYRRKAR